LSIAASGGGWPIFLIRSIAAQLESKEAASAAKTA